MSQEQRLLAAVVGARADIRDVTLRRLVASLQKPVEDGDPVVSEVEVSWDVSHGVPADDRISYEAQMSVVDTSPGLLDISATFSIAYDIPRADQLSAEHFEAFGAVSVTFSIFPYFRELVHSLTTRGGLPPLVLGTLRAPIDQPRDGDHSGGAVAIDEIWDRIASQEGQI